MADWASSLYQVAMSGRFLSVALTKEFWCITVLQLGIGIPVALTLLYSCAEGRLV